MHRGGVDAGTVRAVRDLTDDVQVLLVEADVFDIGGVARGGVGL